MGESEESKLTESHKGLMGSELDSPVWVWHVSVFMLMFNSVRSIRKFRALFLCEKVQYLVDSDFCPGNAVF